MHDLDGSQSLLRQNEYEFNFESEGEGEGEFEFESFEQEGPIGEAETMELASELLEVQSEAELEQFLGSLVSKVGSAVANAGRAVGGAAADFARSSAGQALIGVLKDAAKKALPVLGTAAGAALGGPIGARLGGMAGQGLGSVLGLELEGLSYEDQHFEVAQQFVRLAGEAAQNAAQSAVSKGVPGTPAQKAKGAFIEAAKIYGPGLIRPAGAAAGNGGGNGNGRPGTQTQPSQSSGAFGRHHKRHSGRWVRQGDTVILMGA
jgi:hypothetical protein